jgi:pyruvate/2-oxoglutarate dehydrogenase complex dihydrolipoamide acyltransferase (E2) component
MTFDVDVRPAQEFLVAFEREHGVRAGVQHLVTAAVARCLHDIPALNVKVFDDDIYQLDRVDIAVPVRLEGATHTEDQTGMVVLHDVDKMGLGDIARMTRERTTSERKGTLNSFGSAFARKLVGRMPSRVSRRVLDVVGGALQSSLGARVLSPWARVSTGVTNIGAVFRMPEGARFRSASMTVPSKLGPMASVFAIAPVCEAPIVKAGRVEVGSVLPVVMVVDHRAVDGYLMAKLGERLATSVLDPTSLVTSSRAQ